MAEKKVSRRRQAAKKPTERAIMATIQRLMDTDGVLHYCFVPAYPLDRAQMRQRELRASDLVMIDVHKDRNPRFWRLFHALSGYIADNVEELSGMKHHDALKKVQLDARIHCELSDFVLEDGTILRHWTTKSLAFNKTDETAAAEVWDQLTQYVCNTYFPDWTPEQVADAVAMWERDL